MVASRSVVRGSRGSTVIGSAPALAGPPTVKSAQVGAPLDLEDYVTVAKFADGLASVGRPVDFLLNIPVRARSARASGSSDQLARCSPLQLDILGGEL